jgi:hypothetical protein
MRRERFAEANEPGAGMLDEACGWRRRWIERVVRIVPLSGTWTTLEILLLLRRSSFLMSW